MMSAPLRQITSTALARDITPAASKSCAACPMHLQCLPVGTAPENIGQLDRIIVRRRRVARDERLYRIGDEFKNLYAIRYGHFKSFQISASADEQITGFLMAGELLGLDAISSGRHQCDAVALEDSEVCEIPFTQLQDLFGKLPSMLRQFNRLMSQEITREQSVTLLLGNMRAEQRFAVFLDNLSTRYAARGYSATRFQLRMSRADIGNYLGLTVESISRLLTRFKRENWVGLDKRDVTLLAPGVLKELASGVASARPM